MSTDLTRLLQSQDNQVVYERELLWIIDPTTGNLVVEGLAVAEAAHMAGDLLPDGRPLNCARPLDSLPLPPPSIQGADQMLQIARIYHGSVVDGPGRRSVVQYQGCPVRCPGCYVPETHDPAGGVRLPVADVATILFDPSGAPRDGITISGGEPFAQPEGLLALLTVLKQHGQHTTVYTGYTLEHLLARPEHEIRAALSLIDVLVDGPYIAALASHAGEWRGSRNQRILPNPQTLPAP